MTSSIKKFFRKIFFPKIDTGKAGENAAAKYLKKSGMKIIERNYRNRRSEIDIIAQDAQTLVFVEVKTRSENAKVDGYYSAISANKRRKIKEGSVAYMKSLGARPTTWRYDVVEVRHDGKNKISSVKHFANIGL